MSKETLNFSLRFDNLELKRTAELKAEKLRQSLNSFILIAIEEKLKRE